MKLDRVLDFAKLLLERAVQQGDITVDGTMGNGHDTVFLAQLVGESGHVYSFDIQEQAIHTTANKLETEHLQKPCTLVHDGHEQIDTYIKEEHAGKITGAIYNLGYLPGGDKSIITQADTTIASLEKLFDMMAPEGIIVLVIYHGHPGGEAERDALMHFVQNLSQQKAHVLKYDFINQVHSPPFLIAIEKR